MNRSPHGCLLALALGAVLAHADTDIVAVAEHVGYVAWNNPDTNLFYTLEWQSSVVDTNPWNHSYANLQDIQSSAPTVTVWVPLFYRVAAGSNRTLFPAGLLRTGQTTAYRTNDDGSLHKGIAWAVPRFKNNGDGTVSDQNTGLMWARDANTAGALIWQDAVDFCTNFTAGGFGDWRLPNRWELMSLADNGSYGPALPTNHPFTSVQLSFYWSSTTYANNQTEAWAVDITDSYARNRSKPSTLFVWPVRGGPQP